MTYTERELQRLRIQYARKQTEMVMAYEYRDVRRCFEAQRDAEEIKARIKEVKRNGARKPSKRAEEWFLSDLQNKYGECPDIMKGV